MVIWTAAKYSLTDQKSKAPGGLFLLERKIKPVWSLCKKGAVFFTAAALCFDGSALSASGTRPAVPSAEIRSLPLDVTLPRELGEIKEEFKGRDKRFVFIIQDAHAIPGAQRVIRELIEYIQLEYGVGLVALEGSASRLDARLFKSFPDKRLLADVFEDYFERGEISGGAAAALFNETDAVYHGMEDWDLYEEGLRFFLDSLEMEKELAARLSGISEELAAEKEKKYSPELLEVDSALNAFGRNETDLVNVLRVLASVLPPRKDSELALIAEEAGLAGKNDLSAETEAVRLAEELKAALEDKESRQPEAGEALSELNRKIQDFRTGLSASGDFALFLKSLASEYGIDLRFSPRLGRLAANQKRLKDIEGTRLFRDLELYGRAVKESLFQSGEERKLDAESRLLELTRRLAALELTKEGWEEIKAALNKMDAWPISPDGVDARSGTARLLAEMKPQIRFYDNAEKRDRAFLERTDSLFEKYNTQAAALVAGGFHAEALTLQLKARGTSYVLITPAIGALPAENNYRSHMRGGVSWEKYFEAEGGRVNLYDAFIRAARDSLLARTGGEQRKILKLWRDQVIRGFAAENDLAGAPDALRFIDELQDGESGSGELFIEWRTNIDRFLEGLRRLRGENRLTAPEISKLLRPSAMPAAAGIVFSRSFLRADLMPRVRPPRVYSFQTEGRRSGQRSELRVEELLHDWNEHYRTQAGKPGTEAGHLGIEYRGANMETGPGSIYEFDFLKEAAKNFFGGKDLGLTAEKYSTRKEIETILGEFAAAGILPETLRGEILDAFGALEKAAGKYHSDSKLSGLTDRDEFFRDYYRAASLAFNAVTLLSEAMARLKQPAAVSTVNEVEDGLEIQMENSLHFSFAEGFYSGEREQIGLPEGTDALSYFRADPRRVFAVFGQAVEFDLPLSHAIRLGLWKYAAEFSSLLDTERSGETPSVLFKGVSKSFFDFLSRPEPVSDELWEIYRLGLLEALVPEMRAVRHLASNFNIHAFTVGQHTLYNMKSFDDLLTSEEDALQEGRRIAESLSGRERLSIRLAQLFHDLGKRASKAPTEPDHAIVSSRDIVPQRLKEMGLGDDGIESIAWVVRDHMVLNAFARLNEVRLDTKLPVLLNTFASDPRVSAERLRLLYLISLTDRASVDPWSGIIGPETLERLNFIYEKLNDYLTSSLIDRPREISDLQFEAHTKTREEWEAFKERMSGNLKDYLRGLDIRTARAYLKHIFITEEGRFEPLRQALIDKAKVTAEDGGAFDALLDRLFESFPMDQIGEYSEEEAAARLLFLLHLDLLRETGDRSPVLFFNPQYSRTYEQGYEIVFGAAFDTEGTFEKITGVLLRHRFDIEDAGVRTLAGGGIVDTFTGFFHDDYPDEASHQDMKERMSRDARGLFLGETPSAEALFSAAGVPYLSERKAEDIGTEVLFLEDKEIYGTRASVFTLKTSNRLGLLHVLSRILNRGKLNLVAAPVSTHPAMVNDTFYINKDGNVLGAEEKNSLAGEIKTLMAQKTIDIASLTGRSELRSAEIEEAGRFVIQSLAPGNFAGKLGGEEVEKIAALAGGDFNGLLAGIETSAGEMLRERRGASEAPFALSEAARAQSGRLLAWLQARRWPEGGMALALNLGGDGARYGPFLNQLLDSIAESGREARLFTDKASQVEVAKQIDGKRLSPLVSSTPLGARDLDAGLGEVQKGGQADVPIALLDNAETLSEAISESFLGLALETGEEGRNPDVLFHHELLFVTIFLLMPELMSGADYKESVLAGINRIPPEVRREKDAFKKAVKAVKAEVLKEALVKQLGELGYDESIFGSESHFLNLAGGVIADLLTQIQAQEGISSSA